VSLWSVVRCDRCGTSTSPVPRDSDASDQAERLGWGQRKVSPTDNMQGKGVIDLCPRCAEDGEARGS
jgi:hypothetical protein